MFSLQNWQRFTSLTLFVGVLAIAGCGKQDEQIKTEGEPIVADWLKKPSPPESLKDVKPDATFTATALMAEQKKDGEFLTKQYSRKVVEISGEMESFHLAKEGTAHNLFLKYGGALDMIRMIRFNVTDRDLWRKAFPSQTVVLRARMPAYVWEVVEVKGAPPSTLTAEQFVKEKSADPERFKKMYDDKSLIVTGVINKVEIRETDGFNIYLEGIGDKHILCTFLSNAFAAVPLTDAQKALLKAGQKIKVLGQCRSGSLSLCILLEPAP